MKNSFILYHEYSDYINKLTDEQTGKLLKAIFAYEQDGTVPQLDPITDMVFTVIRKQLDKNRAKYEEICRTNAENGKKGGRPRKQAVNEVDSEAISETEKSDRLLEKPTGYFEKRTKAKKADNDNDNDNDNDSYIPPTPTGGNQPKQASDSKPIEVPFKEIQSLYNSTCSKLSKIREIQGSRRKAVAARFKHYENLDIFRQLFEKANASAFLTGTNDRNWQADFDWLMKANNFNKVLEGKYDGSFNEVKKPPPKSKNFQQRKYTQEELSKMGNRIGVVPDDERSADE
jgi:hypothetical protein